MLKLNPLYINTGRPQTAQKTTRCMAREKRRAAPLLRLLFGHAGEFCICFACVPNNVHPTSWDRANPTQLISSPSAAARGFYKLLFYFPGLPVLIVTRIAFTWFTRSFQNAFAHRSQYLPHASLGSSRAQPVSCCPAACANLRRA